MEFYKNHRGDIFHYAYYKKGWRVFKNGVPFAYGKTKMVKCVSEVEARYICLNCTGGTFCCNATNYKEAYKICRLPCIQS